MNTLLIIMLRHLTNYNNGLSYFFLEEQELTNL